MSSMLIIGNISHEISYENARPASTLWFGQAAVFRASRSDRDASGHMIFRGLGSERKKISLSVR